MNGVATTAAISIESPNWSMPLIETRAALDPARAGPAVRAIRWPRITYATKHRQLANANTNPHGSPDSRTFVSTATPVTATIRAAMLRRVRAPSAARTTIPRNSTAPTVESGSRSTAR